MAEYKVCFEIEGHNAMFARPDTGSTPISYQAPTWSACKAMFESVARGFFADMATPAAFFSPTKVEIMRPIRFEKYVTNYRGPLRKTSQINKKASYQLPATVLVDVCYRVYADCLRIPGIPDNSGNAPHALQEMFTRRLAEGKSKYTPSIGWKEFLPSYFGPIRTDLHRIDAPRLQEGLEFVMPGFLMSMWDRPVKGNYEPVFREVIVKNGILYFPQVHLEDNKLDFSKELSC